MNTKKLPFVTDEIIETGYNILVRRLTQNSLITRKSSVFRAEMEKILDNLGQLYEFTAKHSFKLYANAVIQLTEKTMPTSREAKADILLNYTQNDVSEKTVLDFKFFGKERGREVEDRYWILRNLYWLELYKKEGIDGCYLIIATDNNDIVSKDQYDADSSDFDCRDNIHYQAGKFMEFKNDKPYAEGFSLQNDYHFKWEKINELYFLKIKI